jgi:hypothetical protein
MERTCVTAEERQARISVRAGDGLIFFSQYYSHVHAQILKSSSAGCQAQTAYAADQEREYLGLYVWFVVFEKFVWWLLENLGEILMLAFIIYIYNASLYIKNLKNSISEFFSF